MELKDLIEFFDSKATNFDEFKAEFNGNYIPKSQAADAEAIRSQTTGKITTIMQGKIKSAFGLEADEIKDKKWEDIFDLGLSKKQAEIDALKQAALQTSDSTVRELNDKLEKSNKNASDYKSALDTLKNQYETKEQEWSGKLKGLKSEFVKNNALAKVLPTLSALTEAEDFYLKHTINEKLVIDFDENDQPIAVDKQGNRFQNPNKAGSFLAIEDVITQFAAEKNLIKKNNANDTGRRAATVVSNAGQQQNNTEIKALHPNAAKRAGQA